MCVCVWGGGVTLVCFKCDCACVHGLNLIVYECEITLRVRDCLRGSDIKTTTNNCTFETSFFDCFAF